MWNSKLIDKLFMRSLLLTLTLVTMNATGQSVTPASTNTDAIINLPAADAWHLFSTENGLANIGYQQATVTLTLGERFHAERKVGDSSELIDGTISSFDPQHMISWQWTDKNCWSVLYFNAMGNEMTQIRWLDFCSASSNVDLTVQAKFHRNLFDQLIRRYAPECHVCKEEREAARK